MDNFAGHNLNFETERLRPRSFEDTDFDIALPFYGETDFLLEMEGQLPEESITEEYLRRAREAMAKQGFLFAIVEKTGSSELSVEKELAIEMLQ